MNVILLKGFILTSLFWLSSPWKSRQSYKNWKGKNICVTLIDWKTLSHLGERNQVGLLLSSIVNEYLRMMPCLYFHFLQHRFLLFSITLCTLLSCDNRSCKKILSCDTQHSVHTLYTHFAQHSVHTVLCKVCVKCVHTVLCVTWQNLFARPIVTWQQCAQSNRK